MRSTITRTLALDRALPDHLSAEVDSKIRAFQCLISFLFQVLANSWFQVHDKATG
jgi:hypothetical protein